MPNARTASVNDAGNSFNSAIEFSDSVNKKRDRKNKDAVSAFNPIIPELLEYLSPTVLRSPKLYQGKEHPIPPEYARQIDPGLLQMARSKTEQEQRELLASMQMADIEFQMELSPYMPPDAEIDPSRARVIKFPKEANIGPLGLNKMGAASTAWRGNKRVFEYGGEDDYISYEDPEGNVHKIGPIQPNTVNAVGMMNAIPRIWAHEYRHWEETDWEGVLGEENGYPYFTKSVMDYQEGTPVSGTSAKRWEAMFGNNFIDAAASQTKDDWAVHVHGLLGKELHQIDAQYKGRNRSPIFGQKHKEQAKIRPTYSRIGEYINGDSRDFDSEKAGNLVQKILKKYNVPIKIFESDKVALGPWFKEFVLER
tara:strand:+ start:269 stop:1366 length:1098 start_codon:yes stop_codon:yes gene_type:complete